MPRPLTALAVLAALCVPALAQDDDVDQQLVLLQDRLEEELDRYDDADVEARALIARRLSAWVAAEPELAHQALRRAQLDGMPGAVRLVGSILRAPELRPALDTLAPRIDALLDALARPAPDDLLEAAVAYLRFTDAFERAGDVDATLAALKARAPEHPWVVALERALSRRPAILAIDSALRRLGEPERAARCDAVALGDWPQYGTPDERLTRTRGWLLSDDGQRIELFVDTLRPRTFPRKPPPAGSQHLGLLPRVEPVDVVAECEAVLLAPGLDWHEFAPSPSLDHTAASLVRATWALRRGRPLLACRLVRVAELTRGFDSPVEALQETAHELGASRWQAAIEALGEGATRTVVVLMLDAASDVVASALAVPGGDDRAREALSRLHARAAALRDALAHQAQADRDRPPPPTWAQWQTWSPAERLACALSFLREQDGPLGPLTSGAGPFTTQVFPPDAPRPAHARGREVVGPGTTVADAVVVLGDLAIPALIDLLDDDSPTRAVAPGGHFNVSGWSVLPLSEVAERALEAMWLSDVLRAPPGRVDWRTEANAKQAQARAWLERWGPIGGLGAWHASEVRRAEDDHARARHAAALLRYDPARARELVTAVHGALTDDQARHALLLALGDSGDRTYVALCAADLHSEDHGVAVEAALALARLGDRRGARRMSALLHAGSWAVDPAELTRLAEDGAPREAGALVLQLTTGAPWFDYMVGCLAAPSALPPPDRRLALARIASRAAPDDTFARDCLQEETGHADLVQVLLDACAVDPARSDRHEHAAATALALGLDAVMRLEAGGGPAVRPLLLAALRDPDPRRADAFDDALGLAGGAAATWAAAHLDADDRARVDQAIARASLRVRHVSGPEGQDLGELFAWQFAPWDPTAIEAVLEAWAHDEHGPRALVVERAADLRGVSVRVEALGAASGRLHASVRAPGLRFDGPLDVGALQALLLDLQRALVREPLAPALLRLTP